jgi:branched-chain amino acid transport system permease protein
VNMLADIASSKDPQSARPNKSMTALSSRPTVRALFVSLAVFALGVAVTRSSVDDYTIHLLIMSMIWALFAVGWNLASGFGGMKAFGHQAFFGISGYASALMAMHLGWSPWLTMWLAGLLSAIVSLVVVAPVLRLRSTPQIAIVTLAFGEIARIIIENARGLTRGEMGLIGIPPLPPISFPFLGTLTFSSTDKSGYLLVALALLILGAVVVYLLMRSRIGLGVLAVRDAQDAAESLGLSATAYRVSIFALSAFIVGLSGAFFAHYQTLLTPSESVGLPLMVMIVSMVIVGGHATIAGPIIGAFVLAIGIELFRAIEDYRLLIYGLLIILVMRLMPGGISPLMASLFSRTRGRKA